MSKQRPDPNRVANELAGASAFFRRPALSGPSPAEHASPPPAAASRDQTAVPPNAHTAAPQPDRPDRPGRPVRRLMIRHAFELYADQLDRLRELSDQKRRQGENDSMSKMVRDAIDRLLNEQQS